MPSPRTARQPLKAFFIIFTLVKEIPRLTFLRLAYLLPSLRQDPNYSAKQAFGVATLRALFGFAAAIELKTTESLEPQKEKERWTVINPTSDLSLYEKSPLNDIESITPTKIGANWIPRVFDPERDSEALVVLHFHGGAFISIRPRDGDLASIKQVVVDGFGGIGFFPQYRLANNDNGHFPAALQDAVTAYLYLLKKGVRPSRIVLSGDSAGGNLAIALLRFLTQEAQPAVPLPAALTLWSPWVDMATDLESFAGHRNQAVDYLVPQLYSWGRRVYAEGRPFNDQYLSPARHPFKTGVPVTVAVGSNDTLIDTVNQFVDGMKQQGSDVEIIGLGNAPHDIALAGVISGFMDVAIDAGKEARRILESKGI